MAADERKALESFRARFAYDRALQRLKTVEHYQRASNGFDDAIGNEYALLTAQAAAADAAARESAPADAPLPVFRPPAPEPPPPPPSAAAASPPPPPAEQTIGSYRTVREIGRGGQATVYLAEDTRLPRKVALKVFAVGAVPSEQFLARFRREAEAASRLDHPGICTVYEAAMDGDTPFIAMRFVEGRTLAEWIESSRAQAAGSGRSSLVLPRGAQADVAEGPAGVAQIVALVEKVARALHAAHEAGLVHRDVKSANVIVTREGEPVLLDFGLAHDDEQEQGLTATGTLLGTPAYMSPEQLIAERGGVDRRTDVYSLGVTLYECLTLRRPFDAPTRDALYRSILAGQHEPARRVNPDVPRDLEVVVQTSMEKSRDRRYQTALDFAEDLRRLRKHEPIRARPTPPLVRLGRWIQRHPALATGLAATFAILAFGLAMTAHFLSESREEQRRTKEALVERTDALREAKAATERAEAESRAKTAALRHAQALALMRAAGEAMPQDPMRALLLAREAQRIEPGAPTVNQLRRAVFASLERAEFRGHERDVVAAAFSPAGDKIVTASRDGTARVWDAAGKELAVLRGHEGEVVCACFSSGGERVLTGGRDGTARVWDVGGKAPLVLRGHAAEIVSAIFGSRGDRVLTASADGTARVWDTVAGKSVVLTGHEGALTGAAFSPDGSSVVTSGEDGDVRVWTGDGEPRVVLRGHQGEVASAAFSPKGDRIVTAGADGTARVWNLVGDELATLRGHEGAVVSAAFSRGGDRVVTASADKTARVWDVSGKELAALRGHDAAVACAVFSPRGDLVATASADGTARVWDLAGKPVAALRGHDGAVLTAAFSPAGDRVVTASADLTARAWAVFGAEVAVMRGHSGEAWLVLCSPAEDLVATVGKDRTARLWDGRGKELVELRGEDSVIWSAAFSPSGDRLGVGFKDGTARAWDMQGEERCVIAGHEKGVASVAFSPTGDRIATASWDKTARIWDAFGQEVAVLTSHGGEVLDVSFAPKGERVVTAAWDKTARVWDVSGKELSVLRGHLGWVYSAAFSPSGDRVVTASSDRTAKIWDVAGGAPLATLAGHEGRVSSARFSPRGDLVLTASLDRTARLWRLDGAEAAVLRGHDGEVLTAAFSPAGDLVLTTSGDRTARVWDLDGREIDAFGGRDLPVLSAAFTRGGDRVVTTSSDGTARVWLVRADDLVKLADTRITRALTRRERERYEDVLGEENAAALAVYREVDRLAKGTVLVAELLERVRTDPSVPEAMRAPALAAAAERVDDVAEINNAAWRVVKAAGRPVEEYRLAVRRLEVAARLAPDDVNVMNSLGVAQYRAGSDADALATLRRSDAAHSKTSPAGIVEDLAFLAMAERRAGDVAAARRSLDRLRALLRDPARASSPDAGDAMEFLREAEGVVEAQ